MSTVTVQLFASYAEAFGNSRIEVPLQDGGTVADLINSIRSLPAGSLLPFCLNFLNLYSFAHPDTINNCAIKCQWQLS